jgi:hypothetical protein
LPNASVMAVDARLTDLREGATRVPLLQKGAAEDADSPRDT